MWVRSWYYYYERRLQRTTSLLSLYYPPMSSCMLPGIQDLKWEDWDIVVGNKLVLNLFRNINLKRRISEDPRVCNDVHASLLIRDILEHGGHGGRLFVAQTFDINVWKKEYNTVARTKLKAIINRSNLKKEVVIDNNSSGSRRPVIGSSGISVALHGRKSRTTASTSSTHGTTPC